MFDDIRSSKSFQSGQRFTAEDLAKELGRHRARIRSYLLKMIDDRELDVETVSNPVGGNMTYYRRAHTMRRAIVCKPWRAESFGFDPIGERKQ